MATLGPRRSQASPLATGVSGKKPKWPTARAFGAKRDPSIPVDTSNMGYVEEEKISNGHAAGLSHDSDTSEEALRSRRPETRGSEQSFASGSPANSISRKRSFDSLMDKSTEKVSPDKVLKVSPEVIETLISSPTFLPVRPATPLQPETAREKDTMPPPREDEKENIPIYRPSLAGALKATENGYRARSTPPSSRQRLRGPRRPKAPLFDLANHQLGNEKDDNPPVASRPRLGSRSSRSDTKRPPLEIPRNIPLPPFSMPTYLQLELSSQRPSPLYIHRPSSYDAPYESTKAKLDRLANFLSLPLKLEHVLGFGAFICLDSWLYVFTILPLRFVLVAWIILQWLAGRVWGEVAGLSWFTYAGIGRLWRRRQIVAPTTATQDIHKGGTKADAPKEQSEANGTAVPQQLVTTTHSTKQQDGQPLAQPVRASRPPERKPLSSVLETNQKADFLSGLLVLTSCIILLQLDASRMYHSIRGQAAIKLYVIYNVLEVFDRLLAAFGQDVLECLLSEEIIGRGPTTRKTLLRGIGMFFLALFYNITHAVALFYQVITLNVAVNSYSNALLTLLMSNQFVEIKGTVFKKIERENLFQLTCADVVERFQLWLMLTIIALRNIVEVGGLQVSLGSLGQMGNASSSAVNGSASFLESINSLPETLASLQRWTMRVFGPFFIVLLSEMIVDWVKHAYITKFNNTKSTIYSRFLDVLAKDYYSHAFVDQNLTKRLGLPVLPLACLFIRASVQTYHMFLATYMPLPVISQTKSLSAASASSSPTTAAFAHVDEILRRAFGRSTYGAGGEHGASGFTWWSLDDIIALTAMCMFFLAVYLLLLVFKLGLGMLLLTAARRRYNRMEQRAKTKAKTDGKRVGLWGVTEVGDERRSHIYRDEPEILQELLRKEAAAREKDRSGEPSLDHVDRYTMIAKRIW